MAADEERLCPSHFGGRLRERRRIAVLRCPGEEPGCARRRVHTGAKEAVTRGGAPDAATIAWQPLRSVYATSSA